MIGGNVTEEQQKLIDDLERINKEFNDIIDRVYLMGYTNGRKSIEKEND